MDARPLAEALGLPSFLTIRTAFAAVKISVINPTKERGTAINQAFQSSANQTMSVDEVLIVDGSIERMAYGLFNQAFAGCTQIPKLAYVGAPEETRIQFRKFLETLTSQIVLLLF